MPAHRRRGSTHLGGQLASPTGLRPQELDHRSASWIGESAEDSVDLPRFPIHGAIVACSNNYCQVCIVGSDAEGELLDQA